MSAPAPNKYIVGLCGPVGSGKSVVRRCLEVLWRIPSYDSDQEAKRLYADPDVRRKMRESLGFDPLSPTGTLDKQRIKRALLEHRGAVEEIVHTALFKHLRQWIDQQDSPIVVVESAILYTSGLADWCTASIAVLSHEEIRRSRVLERNPELTDADFDRIEELQDKERELQRSRADYFLHNNMGDSVIEQIELIYNEIKKRYEAK